MCVLNHGAFQVPYLSGNCKNADAKGTRATPISKNRRKAHWDLELAPDNPQMSLQENCICLGAEGIPM